MRIKLLQRLRRWRREERARWAAKEPQRREAKRRHDEFEDDVVSSRSPSMSRLKRW
jgi:hypothetical protein